MNQLPRITETQNIPGAFTTLLQTICSRTSTRQIPSIQSHTALAQVHGFEDAGLYTCKRAETQVQGKGRGALACSSKGLKILAIRVGARNQCPVHSKEPHALCRQRQNLQRETGLSDLSLPSSFLGLTGSLPLVTGVDDGSAMP